MRVTGSGASLHLKSGATALEEELFSDTETSCWTNHHLPRQSVRAGRLEQKYLYCAARGPPETDSSRNDPRIVDDQHVALTHVVGKISDHSIDRHASPCVHKEAGRIALLKWMLSDPFCR